MYIVSKRADIFVGIAAGCFAYHLYERRIAPGPGFTLRDLLHDRFVAQRAQISSTAAANAAMSSAEDDALAEFNRELASAQSHEQQR